MRSALIAAVLFSTAIAHADNFGLTVDAGVPDGATTALVYRPIHAVRLNAGMGYNGITRGYRAGVTLVPRDAWFSPTISVDVGEYPEGDANPLVRMASGDSSFENKSLEHVGYRYANLHVGLEFGSKRATFYLHGGLSRISGRVHDLLSSTDMSSSSTSVTTDDPVVTLTSVSARLGLIVYFH
jgi:hypothetical protein